jgi:hypothetical protein
VFLTHSAGFGKSQAAILKRHVVFMSYMRKLRELHLYLGCLFAPLILYFSLSGAWQLYRLNMLPKDHPETASAFRVFLHEASKPHTHSTLPGRDSKTDQSQVFNAFALVMAVGLVMTTLLGLVLAWQMLRIRRLVVICVAAGVILPIVLILLR